MSGTGWTGPAELRAQLRRLWERGVLLRSLLEEKGEQQEEKALFPLRLTLTTPPSGELAARFEAVRGWIAGLAAIPQLRIEWRAVNHRVLGSQRVPQSVWIDDAASAFSLIGKRMEAARFVELAELTRRRQPALLEWLGKRPLAALELERDWEPLLAVVAWLQQRPRPGIYLRQIDIAGIDSKFIESHRGVLGEWLDRTLPAAAIDAAHTGITRFGARYGLLEKPERIRFRVLDARLDLLPGVPLPDITLDAASFAALDLPPGRVFITENETNFLAFPPVAGSIVLFGAGYGWQAHGRARWLDRCTIHYWGDIDTHGFAILDQLRGRFAHVESFLMDRATLLAHETFWGQESNQLLHDLPRLGATERALFDELRDNRIANRLRLEQERVGFGCVERAVSAITSGSFQAASVTAASNECSTRG